MEKNPALMGLLGYIVSQNGLHLTFTPRDGFHYVQNDPTVFTKKETAEQHATIFQGKVQEVYIKL